MYYFEFKYIIIIYFFVLSVLFNLDIHQITEEKWLRTEYSC